MILDEILLKLEQKNYHKITVNVDGINLYYTVITRQAYIIILVNFTTGEEFTKEQYEHIILQIKDKFKDKNFEDTQLLSILCTEQIEKVKKLCINIDNHWIVDIKNYKLMIFENQDASFLNIRDIIEEILTPYFTVPKGVSSKNTNSYNANPNNTYSNYSNKDYPTRKHNNHRNGYLFTVFNTIIIAINVIIFLLLEKNGSTMDTEYMLGKGAMFWPYVISYNEYYRLFTYMFLHYGLSHLANNMIILIFIGDNLEREVGKLRYLLIYLGTGFIAGLASMGYNMIQNNIVVAVGASGAIFGVVGAMLYIVIVNRGQLEDISSRQLILFAILSIYSGFTSQGTDNIAHIAGFISGMVIAALTYRKPKKREGY